MSEYRLWWANNLEVWPPLKPYFEQQAGIFVSVFTYLRLCGTSAGLSIRAFPLWLLEGFLVGFVGKNDEWHAHNHFYDPENFGSWTRNKMDGQFKCSRLPLRAAGMKKAQCPMTSTCPDLAETL
jgi:hypothetical protein